MKINKTAVTYTINPKDDNESEKIHQGEYLGAGGLSAWLFCDRQLDGVICDVDKDNYPDLDVRLAICIIGEDNALELLQKSVELFMNNCQ